MDHAELWQKVPPLARSWPYSASSEYYAHRDAARALAAEAGLTDQPLAAWTSFVNQKIASMSIYAGD